MQPRQRYNHAKQSKLCLNCLQIYSKNHQCSKQMCRQSQKTLLHLRKNYCICVEIQSYYTSSLNGGSNNTYNYTNPQPRQGGIMALHVVRWATIVPFYRPTGEVNCMRKTSGTTWRRCSFRPLKRSIQEGCLTYQTYMRGTVMKCGKK
jgi:hypothetical protein